MEISKKAEAPDHQLLNSYTVSNMAALKPVKPRILALTRKLLVAGRSSGSPNFCQPSHPEYQNSVYSWQNLLADKGLQLRGQLLNRTGVPLISEKRKPTTRLE